MAEPTAKRLKLSHTLSYTDGLFLAPMVRCGTLPTRLLSLDYGASLVWGPEIIDKAIIGTTRTVDERSGTIQYLKNGKSIWECHPMEKSRLIYQIGSSDPQLALKAAKIVEQDVAGIDLNCGCPKDFSLKGGMGAALLKEPDKLCSILRNLVNNLTLPVSAKIRLLPEQDATLSLVKQIADTGISNLTVHCRTQTMRDREPALLHRLREIVDLMKGYGIPVVANGDCWGTKDKQRICDLTGVTSIMIARGAEANPSCFREDLQLLDPTEVIIPRYTQIAMITNNHFQNTKYCIYSMDLAATSKPSIPGSKEKRKKLKADMSHLKNYEQLCGLFGVDYEKAKQLTLNDVLPGLREKLAGENREIEQEAQEEIEELKHKAASKGDEVKATDATEPRPAGGAQGVAASVSAVAAA